MKKALGSLDWFWIALGILTVLIAVKLSNLEKLDLPVQLLLLYSVGFIGKGFQKITSKKIHTYSKITFLIILIFLFLINI
jgi:hypothetical protein